MKNMVIILLTFFPAFCFAGSLKCEKSVIKTDLINGGPFGYEEVVMTVKNESKDIRLRFEQVHFGIECRTNPKNRKFIVFQAYCGGSACRDLDNYGIIDPKNLRVLLVPHDENRKIATQIFGAEISPVK